MANEIDVKQVSTQGQEQLKEQLQGNDVRVAVITPDGVVIVPSGQADLEAVDVADVDLVLSRITSYNVCYTKLLRPRHRWRRGGRR